ncbi:hypothetical protein GCM10023187_22490 [Nibrella viscosa]|uniref:Uncharacterized protein n=1 Tax=Nibrella viscosa TaxID=1084524 RepID=A0ABP8KDU7_9BACT
MYVLENSLYQVNPLTAMAKAGQVIPNPKSGETFHFIKTAADTGGEYLQFTLT